MHASPDSDEGESPADHVPESEPVAGCFVSYRVLELSPQYSDREGLSRGHVTKPSGGAYFRTTIGSVPDTLLHNLSNAIPIVDGLPAMRAATAHRQLQDADRDSADLSIEQPKFVDPAATYLTIGYVRDTIVDAIPDRWARWVSDCEDTISRLKAFNSEAQDALDRATARLLGVKVTVNRVAHAPRTAHFEPSDHAHMPVALTRLQGSATAYVTTTGWVDSDFKDLTAAIDLAGTPQTADLIVATPAWWYYQAMNEADPLRRFLFSHWGLEALAAKFCKANRETLTEEISANLGLPAKSLLWPTPDGSDRPGRNVEFQFALMAWALKGIAAQDDITRFKTLADLRNKLSHGDRIDHASLPRHDGYLLLREYLSLVVTDESHTT